MKPCLLFRVLAVAGPMLAILPTALHAQAPATPTPTAGITTPSPNAAANTAAAVSHLRRLVRDVASNTDNIRSSSNFGAQLWLTADSDFFLNWRKPELPTLNPVQIAARGQSIFTVIIFYGEAHTETGQGNVSYDISVLRPDGTIYNRRDALVGFQNLAPTDFRELQLGRNYLNIAIAPDDPAGLYTVNVTVHDNVSHVDLPLKQTFVVE